jgi:hypothetical protein
MNYKSINRFFVFALALLTALAFFGVKPSYFHQNKHSVYQIETLESIHDATALPPVGVESKEEQPSEDDENLDSDDGIEVIQKSCSQKKSNALILTNEVRSTSRGNFHCPLYIRIQSIVI